MLIMSVFAASFWNFERGNTEEGQLVGFSRDPMGVQVVSVALLPFKE